MPDNPTKLVGKPLYILGKRRDAAFFYNSVSAIGSWLLRRLGLEQGRVGLSYPQAQIITHQHHLVVL